MTNLRSRLNRHGLEVAIADFACDLLDLTEFDDRLVPPTVHHNNTVLELSWTYRPNTLRLFIHKPGSYHFSAEMNGEEVLHGKSTGRENIQLLRNLFFWLWDEPW